MNKNKKNEIKRVTILGSTGSIGQSTLDLIGRNLSNYKIIALTGNDNIELLAKQAKIFRPEIVVTANEALYEPLCSAIREIEGGDQIEVGAGQNALVDASSRSVDWTMAAIMGAAGLEPTLASVKQGSTVALANKECLVMAGQLFMAEIEKYKTKLLPVDSEHSAAFQAIEGACAEGILKVTLTASGGPFRTWPIEKLSSVQPVDALNHPNWSMGAKITIDSATMMNKGLELIEAKYLFGLRPEQLDIVVHQQSIIHCLVAFQDGSVLAQMSIPDMRVPIAYSLSWPHRISTPVEPLDLAKLGSLHFEAPDGEKFPALNIARQVLTEGHLAGTIMNGANEVAVDAFLSKRLKFDKIADVSARSLDKLISEARSSNPLNLEDVQYWDRESRRIAHQMLD